MDADTVCNEFHLRMTAATTELEKFEQLLSELVPTPNSPVSPANFQAITDARNILVEAIASVCEAYEQLDDVDGDIDPDEERLIEDANATVRKWHENIDQVMVQIRQLVWDSQHGYIKRLISGAHSRADRRSKASAVETEETPAPVASIPEDVPEEVPDRIEIVTSGDDEDQDDEPEGSDEAQDEQEAGQIQEAVGEDPSTDAPEEVPEDVHQEPAQDPVEDVAENPKQPLPTVISQDDLEKIRAQVRAELEAEIRAQLEAEQQAKSEETERAIGEKYYTMGVHDMKEELLKATAAQQAALTADEVAAESTPLARAPKQPKKTSAKKTTKGRSIIPRKKKEVSD